MPAAGFRLEKIRVGGIKNLGMATRLVSAWRLVAETLDQVVKFGQWEPAAVFSMGGYVAGPVVIAAALGRIPIVVMEPNAVPGATNRYAARWVARALLNFEETAKWFPPGRTEVTGMPVRREFFDQPVEPDLAVRGLRFGRRLLEHLGVGLREPFAETGQQVFRGGLLDHG